MLSILIIFVALCVFLVLAFSPSLARSEAWKATVTPLASIMGSGFLVVAPLLAHAVGYFAVPVMAALLLLAYAVGSAIRFNIRYFEPIEHKKGLAQSLSLLSRIVLAGAYFISITYYLQLLSAFSLNMLTLESSVWANLMTTLLLTIITGVGIWRGLQQLERLESYAVSLNLGMIAALLVSLVIYNGRLLASGNWHLPMLNSDVNLTDLRVILGLLIVVQGFETSRYLQSEHSAALRIETMRIAQWISATIYLLFLCLMTPLFTSQMSADVTAIITMVAPVAALLPILISVAAIGSQFSASVADTSGAGGLIQDISQQKVPVRCAYALIFILTVALTWLVDVNTIISYASRAFALFYTLQATIAALISFQHSRSFQHSTVPSESQFLNHEQRRSDKNKAVRQQKRTLAGKYGAVAVICLLVFIFGLPAE